MRAASIENGKAGLLWGNEGGSTRLNGELEARRLERRPIRLCLGEPRLWLIGVEVLVFGEERALRTEGIEGEAVLAGIGLDGEVNRENCDGFDSPSNVLDFFVGELKIDGSAFSESSSSKTDGARRLPVTGWVCLRGEEKVGAMANKLAFSDWSQDYNSANAYHSACFWRWRGLEVWGYRFRQRAGA